MSRANLSGLRDATDILDAAIAATKGIEIELESPNAAYSMKNRLYTAKRRAKDESRKVFQPGEAGYDASPYDGLTISQKQEKITITKLDMVLSGLTIREL